ncbi:MAG: HyaD/HybD family hydrogenase maturation endopeptidase [Desulfovibrionaceae bacterium]|nr:HyaD/HybD family hydrogenase maturation endopeptidase [Desulfovibrionaceae bacterium]
MAQNDRLCVLGVGNIILGDEGFGVRAMEWLRDHYDWPDDVDFIDGGTQGRVLMTILLDYRRVVVLDIVRGQCEPGTVYLLENEDMRKSCSFHDSTHDTDFVDLLCTCDLLGGRPEAFLVGFEPYRFDELMTELTPEAQAGLPEFCRKAAAEIRRRGWSDPVEKRA